MATRPDPPTNIIGIGGSNILTIAWTPASSGGPVSSFTAVGFGIPTNITKTVSSNISTTTLAALNGIPYLPIVFANGPAGSSIPPESITPATMPLPPTTVRVVYTNTTGDAEISWTPPTNNGGANISSYTIYSNSSGSAIIASTTTTSTIVNGFTYGTPYTFTATAVNSAGESVRSAASAPFTPIMLPTSPINVAANMLSSGMSISWETPASSGGTPITGYTILNYIDSNYVAPSTVINSAAISSIILSNLLNGTTYEFGVVARNRVGLSPESDLTSSILNYTVPIAPLGVIANKISTTSSALVSYENSLVNFNISSFNITTIPSTTLTTTSNLSTVVSGLTYGVSYRFSVTATNVRGTSLPTNTFVGVTPLTVPNAPSTATATLSESLANISWTSPTFNGGTAIYAYRITTFDSSGNSEPSVLVARNRSTLQLTTLILGNTYSFGVSALNTIGFSVSTITSSIVITGPPGIPRNLSSISKNTAAILNWTPPSGYGLPISSYTFTTTPDGGSAIYYDSSGGYAVIGGLTNGTPYTISVRANNSDGAGPLARTLVTPTSAVVIPPYIPNPGLVTGPRIYAQSGNFVSIFAGSNFQNFSYAIPIGTWSTMSSISTMLALTPGATTSTISGNISVVFPEATSNLSLILNNGENDSGATRVTYVSSSAATLLSGAGGQFPAIASSNWDYARYIRLLSGPGSDIKWITQSASFNTSATELVSMANFPGIFSSGKPVAADSSGCYVVYITQGTIQGQVKLGNSTKYDIAVARFRKTPDASNNVLEWVTQQATFNTSENDYVAGITSDSTGCYILYQTEGAVSGQQQTATVDIVVARFSNNGTLLWVRQQPTFNGSGSGYRSNTARKIISDSTGCYVLYKTSGIISGQTSSTLPEAVVARFNKEGNLLWVKQRISIESHGGEDPLDIVADPTGCYVIYNRFGITVARLNQSGGVDWVAQETNFGYNMNPPASYTSVSADSDSSGCYVSYITDVALPNKSVTSSYNIVIGYFSKSGSLTWVKQESSFNVGTLQFNLKIAATSDGCYMSYDSTGQVLGGEFRGIFDLVVARFNVNGELSWIKQQAQFNGTGHERAAEIVADSKGCYVLYTSQGQIPNLTSIGQNDILVAHFSPSGSLDWVKRTGSTQWDTPAGIAIGSNDCYIVYDANGTVQGLTSPGAPDIVVARIG